MNRPDPRRLVLALVLVAGWGCETTRRQAFEDPQRWLGRSRKDLEAKWGPPDREVDDEAGGKILVYRGKFSLDDGRDDLDRRDRLDGTHPSYDVSIGTSGQQACTFHVDRDGIIRKAGWN